MLTPFAVLVEKAVAVAVTLQAGRAIEAASCSRCRAETLHKLLGSGFMEILEMNPCFLCPDRAHSAGSGGHMARCMHHRMGGWLCSCPSSRYFSITAIWKD